LLTSNDMISKNCEKADHNNCIAQFYDEDNNNRYQCECSCHVKTLSPETLQVEKDKRGITRGDELRAETVP
jgi:hypothetical protein